MQTIRAMVIHSRKGFTLVEILVVVAIISILSAAVLIGLNQARRSGEDARRIADLRQVQNALELYYTQEGNYPLTTPNLSAESAYCELEDNLRNAPGGPIITTDLPHDPRLSLGAGATPCPNPTQGTEGDYMYNSSDGLTYVLGAALDSKLPRGAIDDPTLQLDNDSVCGSVASGAGKTWSNNAQSDLYCVTSR